MLLIVQRLMLTGDLFCAFGISYFDIFQVAPIKPSPFLQEMKRGLMHLSDKKSY